MRKIHERVLIVVWLVIILVVLYAAFADDKPAPIPEQKWCEVGIRNADGTITYSGQGPSELILVATNEGPKLMMECN